MYNKILVPLDGSATARRGLREAIGLAQVHGARLLLLHVVDDYPLLIEASASAAAFDQVRDAMRRQGEAVLAEALTTAEAAGVEAEKLLREVTAYRVAQAIVEESRRAACDLIVMGTHGRRGISRLMLGSDAEAVLKSSSVPVLLVRDEEANA